MKNNKEKLENITDLVKEGELLDFLNDFLSEDTEIQAGDAMDLIHSIEKIAKNTQNSEENTKQAKKLIDIAQEDLETSKLLYEENLPSQSIYHLQQSVEKTAKAFGLYYLFFDTSNLTGHKGIRHITPKAFVKMLQKDWVNSYLSIIQAMYKEKNSELEPNLEKFHNLLEKEEKIARLDQKQIRKILKISEELRENWEKKGLDNEIDSRIEKVINELPNSLKEYIDVSKTLEKIKHRINLDSLEKFINLYLLSLITYPHFNYTRYPDEDVKPEEYSDLGVTEAYPQIIEKTEDLVKKIKNEIY